MIYPRSHSQPRWICDCSEVLGCGIRGKDLGLEAAQLPLYEADQGFSKCSTRTSCKLVNLRLWTLT